MKYLAKPSGITLDEHVANVVAQAENLLKFFPISIKKYAMLSDGKDFEKWLKDAAKYHDDGKKHKTWQSACKKDNDAFVEWQGKNGGGTFKDFERAEKAEAGKHLRQAGVRHEIASLIEHKEDNFALPVWVAIAAHHGKLNMNHERRWKEDFKEEGYDIWKALRKESRKNVNGNTAENDFDATLKCYPPVSGVRAWLVAADQWASAKEGNPNEEIILKKFTYKFPHSTKRNVQQIVEEHWKDSFLLMRAPTGAGKTDASLLWAQKQIEDKRAERLVIAMPTRFTSNALAINVTETLSATGLYHSTAWQTRFDDALKTKSITMQYARNEHDLARRLFAPVTVCTIDHLLMALTLTKEDHHQILFNLMNSCLVIDEADFYDAFTQANIQVLLRALYKWNVPVMLMSASLPESSIQFYRKTGYEIKEIKEDKSDLDRPRCHVKKIIDDFEMIEGEMETLLSEALVQDAVIVYANTVDRAIQYYEWFRKKGKEPIVYHSRFVEADKKAKETLLLEMLGKDAKHRKGIAILTQIGEMSVNISTDWMISDICPIDRLVQRAGRLCRFDNNVGQLHIVIPKKGDKLYPAPYGTFKKEVNQWIPHDALTKTIEEVEVDKKYSAGDFVAFINKVYQKESIFTIKEKENAKLLKEFFIENWLIGGRVSVKEDDENAGEWKSRDITGQETVFIEKPENPYFNSWLNYQTLKNEKSIVIPIYLVEKGKKQFYLRTMDIYIGDDKKVATTITYIDGNQGVYSFETGFRIPRERDEFM